MPFTQVQPQAPVAQPTTPAATNPFMRMGFGGQPGTAFSGFGRMQSLGSLDGTNQSPSYANDFANRLGGAFGMAGMGAGDNQSLPQYTYTPAAIQPMPNQTGLQSLNAVMPGQDLYSNTQAPWYIPPQQPATGQGLGGWDASSFMQGLRSLQPNLPGGK